MDDTIMSEQVRYSMLIQWSDEDQAYLVALPEWEGHLFNWDAATHGATYEEAARNGREVLELLVEAAREEGAALPAARVFAASTARCARASTRSGARSTPSTPR